MSKKIIAIILASSFALCTFAGCAKEENSEPVQKSTSQIQTEAKPTDAVSMTSSDDEEDSEADIYPVFKSCLEDAKINGELPKYSVFDINDDGTAELLIFDERIATAIERGITVYAFDKKTNTAKEIGRAETFEGHSKICSAADGNGFIIQQDYPGFIKVIRYTFDGEKLIEEKLIDKTYDGDNINAVSEDEKGNEYLGDEIISSLDMGEGEESRLFEKAFG